jgi:hypothetical protein
MPTEFLDQFRASFHRDFPYDHKQWRDSLVLESREGIRFHFLAQSLINASAFFAGAPVSIPSETEIPVPGHGRLQPIPLMFASSLSLQHLLSVLRQSPIKRKTKAGEKSILSEPSWNVVIEAVRVADILEAPDLVKMILKRTDLDIHHRSVIETACGVLEQQPTKGGEMSDISFNLDTSDQYQRCHRFFENFYPSALAVLERMDRRRKTAIANIRHAWTEPDPQLLVRACSSKSKRAHAIGCNTRMISVYGVLNRMQESAPIMMEVLAAAKTKRQRTSKIRAMLSPRVNGCRGCLGDLARVYMPALKIFQTEFPEMAKRI